MEDFGVIYVQGYWDRKKRRGFGFDLGENSAIRWRCLDVSSIGSHLIGFLRSLSGSMV